MTRPASIADLGWPLRTSRLTLRPATEADAVTTWRYYQSEPVQRWTAYAASTSAGHRQRFVATRRLSNTLVVELGNVVIGDLKITIGTPWAQEEVQASATCTEATLGWVFDPEYGGCGYATEAVHELLRISFTELRLRRVSAYCFADNEPSWRLMERVGMRAETHAVANALHRTRGWIDSLGYGLLVDEWRERATTGGHRLTQCGCR